MRIDTSINASSSPAPVEQAAAPVQEAPPEIRVSFDPITREDMTLSGMTRWMNQQLGVGAKVNLLA